MKNLKKQCTASVLAALGLIAATSGAATLAVASDSLDEAPMTSEQEEEPLPVPEPDDEIEPDI